MWDDYNAKHTRFEFADPVHQAFKIAAKHASYDRRYAVHGRNRAVATDYGADVMASEGEYILVLWEPNPAIPGDVYCIIEGELVHVGGGRHHYEDIVLAHQNPKIWERTLAERAIEQQRYDHRLQRVDVGGLLDAMPVGTFFSLEHSQRGIEHYVVRGHGKCYVTYRRVPADEALAPGAVHHGTPAFSIHNRATRWCSAEGREVPVELDYYGRAYRDVMPSTVT